MAAYNPRAGLFRRQVESIKAQSFTNWTCIITVDAEERQVIRTIIGRDRRFKVVRNRKRLGFYRNFEKAISLAPPANFIALADQDDRWNPDKLETLLSAFGEHTQLVYSDCRIVSADGEVLSPTFWHNRRNNFTNLACLTIANSVTGAACMFRAALVDQILPFPEDIRETYHDHWIAIVAAANGDIGYVDRPLYDYVQHGGNVIGHDYKKGYPGFYAYGREILRHARRPRSALAALRETTRQGVEGYGHVRKIALLAKTAMERSDCSGAKRRVLARLARYDSGLFIPITERVRAAIERRPSLNVEGVLLHAAVSEWAHRVGVIKLPAPEPKARKELLPPVITLHPTQMPQDLFVQHPVD